VHAQSFDESQLADSLYGQSDDALHYTHALPKNLQVDEIVQIDVTRTAAGIHLELP